VWERNISNLRERERERERERDGGCICLCVRRGLFVCKDNTDSQSAQSQKQRRGVRKESGNESGVSDI
jgi:hypothetical protein